jgi:alanine dehydrogenase
MNIGVPRERRPFEYRVGLSPAGVDLLVERGHTVFVEHDAGVEAGFSDQEYMHAGGKIVYSCEEVFGRADLVLKIARPMQDELEWIQPGAALAGFLQLASSQQSRVKSLLEKNITSIAYEQVRLADGTLPVMRPFSQIGGMMTAQIAARLLQHNYGGKGILLGGIAGVPPAEVVILGGGTAGSYATKAFLGMGAHVTVLDRTIETLQRMNDRFPSVVTMIASRRNIERVVAFADVMVGAVHVPGERTPLLVTRDMLTKMKRRSIIIDLSIDLGGCFESSRPTTHDRPTYVEEGIIHYCVPNVPGAVGRTATHAFINSAMRYIMELADGVDEAIEKNHALAAAVNTYKGELRHLVLSSLVDEEGNEYGMG